MNRTRRITLVALLAILAVVAVPAGAAMALPASATNPKALNPGTIAAAPTLNGALTSLIVDTDSVVATAWVGYTGSASLVTVVWNDGAVSRVDPRLPNVTQPQPQNPPGTVRLTHAYAAGNGTPFTTSVDAMVTVGNVGYVSSRTVTITPTYEVTQSPAYVAAFGNCSPAALGSGWKWLFAQVPLEVVPPATAGYTVVGAEQEWKFPALGSGWQILAGSQFTNFYTMKEGHDMHPALEYSYDVNDMVQLDPSLGSRPLQFATGAGAAGYDSSGHIVYSCQVRLKTTISVTLWQPGLSTGPVMAA